MQLTTAIQAQTLFLPKRSLQRHGRRQNRFQLAARAHLNPLLDVAISIGPIDNPAVLALPAIGGAVLT
jgi:hypothetical protein